MHDMNKATSNTVVDSRQGTGSAAGSDAPAASQWSRGLRETIESIAIAFALAFLFKAFEAEAFVIPTGSMAPTLMGRHKDAICPECGAHFTASGSDEADRNGNIIQDPGVQVVRITCPNCRFPMSVDPQEESVAGRTPNPSYSGDRIWVSKVAYQLMEPRRWDVIVFRYPEEAETYYIKRLVGLPNEKVKILHGDIYTQGPDDADFVMQRKPPEKVRAMAQVVHDNDYVSKTLVEREWPLRWQSWPAGNDAAWQASNEGRSYRCDGAAEGESWLRYQHIVPSDGNWFNWTDGTRFPARPPRPQLITDFYAFNARVLRRERDLMSYQMGLHWVGDLMLDCQVAIEGDSGQVLFDLVKGGRHFGATIDVATGEARLSIDGLDDWHPKAATSVRGGTHRVMFANVDGQLLLWIDDTLVEFDSPTTYDDLDNGRPTAGGPNGSDLAPLGVGSRGVAVTVDHLRVLRDIYYVADTTHTHMLSDYQNNDGFLAHRNVDELADFFSRPREWQDLRGGSLFDLREPVVFPLEANQFFVLGDNSPASSDARLWRQHYVERDLLVGKALFVYWPHPLNLPIPFTGKSLGIIPNLPSMGFIR